MHAATATVARGSRTGCIRLTHRTLGANHRSGLGMLSLAGRAAVGILGVIPLRPFVLSLGLLFVGIWAIMPQYVNNSNNPLAVIGVGFLACWLVMSWFGDWRRQSVSATQTARARIVEEVSEDLARAHRLLPTPEDRDRLDRFDEAIIRGNFVVALEELEILGLAARPTPEYWYALSAAAGGMGLDEVRVRLEGRGVALARDGAEQSPSADGG